MPELFNEIIQVKKIALVARLAAEAELEGEDNRAILSLVVDLTSDLASELEQRESEIKSLYERGCRHLNG